MIPLVVNTAETMVKIRVITVKDYSEKTLKSLHKIGVLHVEQSTELKPVDRAAIEHERGEVSQLLTYVDSVLSRLPEGEKVSPAEDTEVIYTRPFSELNDEVVPLYTRLTNLRQRTIEPGEELKQLTELKKYLEPFAQQTDLRLRDLDFSGRYLFSRILVLDSEKYESLHNQIGSYVLESMANTVENETVCYVIGKIEDQKTVESLVTETGGRILPVPEENLSLRKFLELSEDRIRNLERELAVFNEELVRETSQNLERLVLLSEVLSAENERLLVLERASEAKYVTLIEGWIPEGSIEPALSELRDQIDYIFIDTRQPEPSEEPPTKMKNIRGFKPFEVVVNLFGTPKYREWDPTPIVAYSFALFFGLMVGDVVYALGIILLGRFLLRLFADDPESDGFKLFQRLIYISGGVALVIGLLTGTYLGDAVTFFGVESIALVDGIKQTLQNPISFVVLALFIGLVHVNMAHILALIRGIRNKGIVLNKVGILVFQLFGIPYLLHTLLNADIPLLNAEIYPILAYCMLAGIILIIVGCIIQRGGLGGILWLFDLTGILGDVMSYARLAGVGLATFYLASTFNMLAELFSEMIPGVAGAILGSIIGIVILVFGHVINVVLSVITGFIHSLRLCFVEFLFKFYEGGGRTYSPFKLRTKTSLVVTERA